MLLSFLSFSNFSTVGIMVSAILHITLQLLNCSGLVMALSVMALTLVLALLSAALALWFMALALDCVPVCGLVNILVMKMLTKTYYCTLNCQLSTVTSTVLYTTKTTLYKLRTSGVKGLTSSYESTIFLFDFIYKDLTRP